MEMITANDMGMRVALLCQKREILPVMPFDTYYALILVDLLSPYLPSIISITHSECEALSSAESRIASFKLNKGNVSPIEIVVAEISQTPKKHNNWYELRQNIKIISVLCNATDNDAEKAHRMLAYLCNYRH